MDRIEPPTWGETLDRWFARLDTEKFRTGVRERLLAQALLSRLAASGELPATPKEMLALAAPRRRGAGPRVLRAAAAAAAAATLAAVVERAAARVAVRARRARAGSASLGRVGAAASPDGAAGRPRRRRRRASPAPRRRAGRR